MIKASKVLPTLGTFINLKQKFFYKCNLSKICTLINTRWRKYTLCKLLKGDCHHEETRKAKRGSSDE